MNSEVFTTSAKIFSDVNACLEFFSWVEFAMKKATSYLQSAPQLPVEDTAPPLPVDDNTAPQLPVEDTAPPLPVDDNTAPQLPFGDNTAAQRLIQLDTKLGHLKNGLWKLRIIMPKMHDLIDRVEWQSHKKQAAVLLPHIKDAVYDAEDLLDEFDYYVLKAKVECNKKLGHDHLRDTFEEFLHSVESDDYIRKINEIQANLDYVHRQCVDMDLHLAPLKFDKSVRPETSSYKNEPKIFGRQKELKELLERLGVRARKRGRTESRAKMTELPVLPVVGMGGVGKTTMAQQICNDSKVKNHFDLIIWTCVSDDFDIKKLTKEIIEHLGGDASSNHLNVLMRKLEGYVKSKRFLLVLDDMWDDILGDDGARWRSFCEPLKNGAEGSRILVTTRSPQVASLVGPTNHYELKGLQNEVFWDFFKFCAFGSTSSCNNREALECIGKNILSKLKGSPLAAKTIGRLLRMDLSTPHWKNIVESELWRLEQTENDILPALQLSYMYLPQKLKRCFSICAMYPKDYMFDKCSLADIWTAQGYVAKAQEASLCFDTLVNRAFFQKASPQSDKYVIHDLMHDTAQLVSHDECFIIKHATDIDKVPSNVRHLSIFANGNVGCSELKRICNKKNLRSLVCNESYSRPKDFSPVIDCWFKELMKIRVLSFRVSKVKQIPESIGNAKHLRYLRLLGGSTFKTLPSSVCHLHHLKTIDGDDCVFERFPPGFSDAISLQKIKSKEFTYNKDHLGELKLSWPSSGKRRHTAEMMDNQMEVLPHWNLQRLDVCGYGGKSCPTWFRPNLLPGGSDSLNRLEELSIRNCEQINWQGSVVLPSSLRKLILCKSGYSMDNFVSCFLDLTSLTYLEISRCKSLTYIPLHVWIVNLPSLEGLNIEYCECLTSISISGASSSSSSSSGGGGVKGFSSLAKIRIQECYALLSLEEFLTPDCLPVVKSICVSRSNELTLSVDRLEGLQELEICYCGKLNPQRVMAFPSSLKKLILESCEGIESIDLANRQLGSSPALEELQIMSCQGLRSIGGATAVAKIENVLIRACPELKEVQQPLDRGRKIWSDLERSDLFRR